MLRRQAVSNQEAGQREFTSKDTACCLGIFPEELSLWTRLDLNDLYGVALVATLATQSDKAPAQYQFKHLSFQEGLYAEHLLMVVSSLAPPAGPGWQGWASDTMAAEFLNNRYMNNTCRIAAGYLGGLLALQRPAWDFREAPLSENGRSALFFLTDVNTEIQSVNIARNEVSWEDMPGLKHTISTCPKLATLDLSENDLGQLVESHKDQWHKLCEAFFYNRTLTDLNLNQNRLGMQGARMCCNALRGCKTLKRLGFSYNEPGVEPALAELVRVHPALTCIELVEALDRHLPSRAKDEIGRALLENKAQKLGYLHCSTFVLADNTRSLTWPKEALTADAVLLAGVLRTNSQLTAFNIAPGAELDNKARSEIGQAMLNNVDSHVAFCNEFGLTPSVTTCEFDLAQTEFKDVEPFRLLAGCLRGNTILTHLTLHNLRMEHISTLALALGDKKTLQCLELIATSRSTGGRSVVQLPVPDLNGSREASSLRRIDMSKSCVEGTMNRVTCAMIGTLLATNTVLECLDLSGTGVGLAVAVEADGGHILFGPICGGVRCPINEIILDNIQLSDKGGGKLMNALYNGLVQGGHGYEKITSISIASNDCQKVFTTALKQLLWSDGGTECMLQSLNVSHNVNLDGLDLGVALKRNSSLTSLDIRGIPGANTDEVYTFLASHLLQDNCRCRLGFLSCDAFQIVPDQADLTYDRQQAAAGDEVEAPFRGGSPKGLMNADGPPNQVIQLLAGVVKFNKHLTTLRIANGLNNKGATALATAMRENRKLEHLDISGQHMIGVKGIVELSTAIRAHKKLQSFKVDGTPLPVIQLKTETDRLNVAHWELGKDSGYAMGTILKSNSQLSSLNLANNEIGATGVDAVVKGLSESQLKTIDLSRNGLQAAGDETTIEMLSMSICRNLGLLTELKIDDNELTCDGSALAPLCKLRSLRTLSLEKNRLPQLPPLIGALLSLRRLLLFSNQLTELPASLCLLTTLEVLDVHKNMINSLPSVIGKLTTLTKLDISENKLSELPISICELSEELQFSVGRNPLTKPSVEQARQGIGAIRRFFTWSPSKEDASVGTSQLQAQPGTEMVAGGKDEPSPPERWRNQPSRHDWASPGGITLVFNCHGCSFSLAEGTDPNVLTEMGSTATLTAMFNMQVVGQLQNGSSPGQSFAERLEFYNMWLPWSSQTVLPGETPKLLIQARGAGRARANLIATPWLAYACSIGAKVKTPNSYATVVSFFYDDRIEIVRDGVAADVKAIDPRPDTMTRTPSPSYKDGQKLMLVNAGRFVDAVVEEWFGLRRGSRHRVRLIGSKSKTPNKAAAAGGAKADNNVNVIEVGHSEHQSRLDLSSRLPRPAYADVVGGSSLCSGGSKRGEPRKVSVNINGHQIRRSTRYGP